MTAIATAIDYWDAIVEAVLLSAFDRDDEAVRALARAKHYGPVSDELHHAVRGVTGEASDGEMIRETQTYLDLEARYASLYENYQMHIERNVGRHEEQARHLESNLDYLDKEYAP